MTKIDAHFRQAFSRMAPQAVITREELAALLATSAGAISQMTYRGELPPTAFPGKRRACWFVKDIRDWLDTLSVNRSLLSAISDTLGTSETVESAPRRLGRPRQAVSDATGTHS